MEVLPTKKPFTLKDRLKSFVYAFKGIRYAMASQHNLWIHIVCACIAIMLGFVFNINTTQWIAIVLSIGLVMAAEVFNSAIESLVDMVSPVYNKKAGIVKDMAAAAVLITAIMAAIVGIIIFLPSILHLFK
jgi:diacylglycerol kinase (ATP)